MKQLHNRTQAVPAAGHHRGALPTPANFTGSGSTASCRSTTIAKDLIFKNICGSFSPRLLTQGGCAVDRIRSSVSNRPRGFNVRATAEATSIVETSLQQNVELPTELVDVDAPATKRVYFEVFREVRHCAHAGL